MSRPPTPPFTAATAAAKVQAAEDAWNTRDPEHVVQAYTVDSRWRNRSEFITGHAQITAFLDRKWKTRARLRPAQAALGLHRRPDRRHVPVRMARRRRAVVAQPR